MSVMSPPTGEEIKAHLRLMSPHDVLRWIAFSGPILLPLLANDLASRGVRGVMFIVQRAQTAPTAPAS